MAKQKEEDILSTILKEEKEKDLEEKNSSILMKLRSFVKPTRNHRPLTFSVGIAIILFFVYLPITFVSILNYKILLIVLLPSIYIFLLFIKHEMKREQKKLFGG